MPITIPVRVSPVAGSSDALQLGPRQAEVEQLHAVRREEHVRRLEVAVDDAARVQRGQRGQHAEADRHRLGDAQRPAPQALGERLALEQLHGDEQLAAVLADLVDLADVRMVDAGRGAGLAPEALARGLVAAPSDDIVLSATRALQPLVARRVDDAHPALAELARRSRSARCGAEARPERAALGSLTAALRSASR